MTTIWKSDSCDCILEYDDNINFIKAHSVCKLHIIYKDQQLLDNALSHNQSINIAFKVAKQKEVYDNLELKELTDIKKAEKTRIRSL